MMQIAVALAPVFLAILAGWGARMTRVVPETAWTGVNRLAYMILAPVFMFTEIVRADLSFEEVSFAIAGVASFAAMGVLGFALWPVAGSGPTFASAHQGVVRWNTFVILAASAAVLGPEGAALVALLMGPGIPVVNVITVSVHSRWGEGQNASLKGVLRSLATNPLLIACLLGLAINLSGVNLPGPAMDFLTIIGRGALGVTLMCVGAGLDLRAITARPGLMAAAVGMKLVVGPLVFVGMGLMAGLQGVHLAVLAIAGAAPSPPAAYILTREMGGDPRFMAGHITATTLLSAVAIPTSLWFAGLFG
jgi:malonate transporter and related proteins